MLWVNKQRFCADLQQGDTSRGDFTLKMLLLDHTGFKSEFIFAQKQDFTLIKGTY